MKQIVAALMSVACIFLLITIVSSEESPKKSAEESKAAEELFKHNCAVCHPDGENVINKDKTLHKKDLDEHGIKKPADIVKLMRNPGPGMKRFDEKTISDKDAIEIAKYILKTFK
jgi:cytochrome c6